jgi:formylglycine-generating enzyme required for sulfatase activity
MADCRPGAAVFDLSGNVWEWEDACAGSSGALDSCRIRGGGYNNTAGSLVCAADSLSAREDPAVNVGFRCCADVEP